MLVRQYSVFDSASGVYDGPFPGRADAEVMRNFRQACLKEDSPIANNPGDFTLFFVGVFDDSCGEMIDKLNERLLNGLEAVADIRNGVNGKEVE